MKASEKELYQKGRDSLLAYNIRDENFVSELVRSITIPVHLPSATCFSSGTRQSTVIPSFSRLHMRPMITIRLISCGCSRSSNNICLNAPALEPISTCPIVARDVLVYTYIPNENFHDQTILNKVHQI